MKNWNTILPGLWMVTRQLFGITRSTCSFENRTDISHAIPRQCDQPLEIKNVKNEGETGSRTRPTCDDYAWTSCPGYRQLCQLLKIIIIIQTENFLIRIGQREACSKLRSQQNSPMNHKWTWRIDINFATIYLQHIHVVYLSKYSNINLTRNLDWLVLNLFWDGFSHNWFGTTVTTQVATLMVIFVWVWKKQLEEWKILHIVDEFFSSTSALGSAANRSGRKHF